MSILTQLRRIIHLGHIKIEAVHTPSMKLPMGAGTTAHRQRWFRAFWESEAPRLGMAGATGFTGWVDSQTLGWRQQQAGAIGQSSPHYVSIPRQVGFFSNALQ